MEGTMGAQSQITPGRLCGRALAAALLLTRCAAGAATYRYYFPEIIDGTAAAHSDRVRTSASAVRAAASRPLTLRTTFVIVNTSTTEANITIAASADDGSPRALNIPGVGADGTLSEKLPPG